MATVGSASAPSQNTVNYDAMLSTTLFAYKPTMYDNIFKNHAFLTMLRQKGAVMKQNGGERVQLPLMYEGNSTFGPKGAYGIVDTTPQDGMTSAFYEWREVAGSISISRKEERQNSGEARMLNLLEQKTKQAEMQMGETLNNDLVLGAVSGTTFVPSASSQGDLSLNPLGYFLRKANATDPTKGGNVGNIAGATYSWWRHNTAVLDSGSTDTGNAFALAVTTYKGLVVGLKRMYNYCSRGSGGGPDIVVMNQGTFETYENALDDKVRYLDTKMADVGFDAIKLKGATVIWDEQVPDIDNGTAAITSGSAFFINSKFYQLVIDSETDIVTTPFVEPENQTVKTAKVLFMGNAAVSNMRKHGVCYAISQSIVA